MNFQSIKFQLKNVHQTKCILEFNFSMTQKLSSSKLFVIEYLGHFEL